MTDTQFKPRDIFGGAIVLNIPEDFLDVSNIRQVPDNQEAFIDPRSDMSLIVEILQRVDKEDDREAIEFHFNAIAEDNSALSARVFEILPSTKPSTVEEQHTSTLIPTILRGQQEVSKFNRPTFDEVSISLALFRIDFKNVDIVISVNTPAGEHSESMRAPLIFTEAVSSFSVRDFDLFA